MTISNAQITDTHLGFEDHGIFTFILTVQYGDGSGQGIGIIALDEPIFDKDGKFIERSGTDAGMQMIMDILYTVGVDRWEKLKGRFIRVDHGGWGSRAGAIGHINKENWLKIKG